MNVKVMNVRVWMAAMLVAAVLPSGSIAGAADTGVAGKWSTEAGRYLAQRKEAETSDVPIYETATGLRPNVPGRVIGRSGGTANMGRGNSNGRGAAAVGRGAPGGVGTGGAFGVNNGAGMARGNAGALGGNGLGNNGGFNNGLGTNGVLGNKGLGNNGALGNSGLSDNAISAISAIVARSAPLNIPEGRSFVMELKIDKKNKITGSVVALDYDVEVKEEKMKIEDGVLVGTTFTFSTTRKIKDLKFLYKWKGEQTSQNTIRLVLIPPSGLPEGEPESIVFRRDQ